jgi:serpin B
MRSKVLGVLPILTMLVACEPSGSQPRDPSNGTSAGPSDTGADPMATNTPTATPTTPVPPPAADSVAKLAAGTNAFGFDLYQRLRKTPGNVVMSPASITTALSMTWGGAKGETASQMKKVLHLDGTPDDVMKTSGQLAQSLEDPSRPITFRIANQLFGEKAYTFEQPFMDKTKAAYGAPLELVDFKGAPDPARVRINAWVEKETEKRIKDLIPKDAIKADTRLVLVNAIYFLGDWATPFEKERTSPAAFFTTAKDKKDVPMMNAVGSYKGVAKDGLKVLELPYKGDSMSMLLVLPDKVDGLDAVEKSLDAKKLADLGKALTAQRSSVSLPKFEVAPPSIALAGELQELGMKDAFIRIKADFTGIANPPTIEERLFISHVFHKAFVKVDEKGTEAAAATAVVMAEAGAAPMEPPFQFKADHPFLFFIRDNASGLILFMGRVADPSKS